MPSSKEYEVRELEESTEELLLSGVSSEGLVLELDTEVGLNKGAVFTRTGR